MNVWTTGSIQLTLSNDLRLPLVFYTALSAYSLSDFLDCDTLAFKLILAAFFYLELFLYDRKVDAVFIIVFGQLRRQALRPTT